MTHFKHSILISICSLLAGIAAILLFLILPSIENISNHKKIIATKQSDFTQQEDRISLLREVSKDSANISIITEKVNNLWPEEKNVSNFIVDLERLALSEKLTFDNVSITEPKAPAKSAAKNSKKSPSKIQFSFITAGAYDQIMAAVKKLERFDRFNSVEQVELNTNEGAVVTAKITGSIYYGK